MSGVEDVLFHACAWVRPRPDGFDFELGGMLGSYVTGELLDVADGPFTRCAITLPVGAPAFRLEIRPKTNAELAAIARGDAVDIGTDDPAFDTVFVVEGAPSEVARALLSDAVRAAVLSAFPCRTCIDEEEIAVWREGTWTDAANGAVLFEAACALLGGYEAIPQALQKRRALSSYRGQMKPASAAVTARAQNEVRALSRVLRRRARLPVAKAVVGVLALLFGALLALQFLSRCAEVFADPAAAPELQ